MSICMSYRKYSTLDRFFYRNTTKNLGENSGTGEMKGRFYIGLEKSIISF